MPEGDGWHGDVLLFDQFEEVLTVDPSDREAKAAFFDQVGEVLRDRNRWALFSMREEFVATLDPYLRPIPARFDKGRRYRLDLLGADAAREAMQGPPAGQEPPVLFTDDAAHQLADDLRRAQVQTPDGTLETVKGTVVEPVQLQVVCRQLWERLADDDLTIDVDDLQAVGDVDAALRTFYAETVAGIAAEQQVSERTIREWIDRHLITESGFRGQVLMGAKTSHGLATDAIWPLVNAHLLRAEQRRGATWFELAHDRLIEPVRADNAAWTAANLSMFQRQAALWEQQKRSDGLLLRGEALDQAEQWAQTQTADLLAAEDDFLKTCRAERKRYEREQRQNRLIQMLAIAATVVAIIAVIFGFLTLRSQKQVENAIQRARLGELGAESQLQARAFPQRAMLLAIEALHLTQSNNQLDPTPAEQGLRDALAGIGGYVLTGHHRWITNLKFSPDSKWLITAGFDKRILGWQLDNKVLPGTPITIQEITMDEGVEHLLFTDDGHWLITIGAPSASIRLWDVSSDVPISTSIVLQTNINYFPFTATVSPDGRWLAVARNQPDGVMLWDLHSSNVASSLIEILLNTDDEGRIRFEFDRNSHWLVSGSGFGRTLRLSNLHAPDPANSSFDIPGPIGEYGFSPDGKWLSTQHGDGRLKFWNLSQEEPIQNPSEFDLLSEQFVSLEYSQDMHWLAAATQNGLVVLMPLDESGLITQEVTTLEKRDEPVFRLSFSSDSRWLAGANRQGGIRLWSISPDGHPSENQHTLDVEGDLEVFKFSPDSRWLVASGSNTVHVWWLRQPDNLIEYQLRGFDTARIDDFEFSPNGEWLAASSGGRIPPNYEDGTVRLWNLKEASFSTEPSVLRAHDEGISGALTTSNHEHLVTAGERPDNTVRIWNLDAPEPTSVSQILAKLDADVEALALSPENRWLLVAYGGYNVETGTLAPTSIGLWDLTLEIPSSQEPFILWEGNSSIISAVFSDDAQWLVALGETLLLWNLKDGVKQAKSISLGKHEEPVWSAAFSHDSKWLVAGADVGTVRTWDLTAKNPSDTSSILGQHSGFGDVGVIAISPDDQWVVTGEAYRNYCDNCVVNIWSLGDDRLATRPRATLVGHTAPIHKAIITSESSRVITASEDGTVRIWNLGTTGITTDSKVLWGHTAGVNSIALSENGQWLVSGSEDGTARVWNLATDDPNGRSIVLNGHAGRISAVMFYANDSKVITTGNDGTVRIWSVRAEEVIDRACSIVGRNLKLDEWVRFFPGEVYRSTCNNLPNDETVNTELSVRKMVDDGLLMAQHGDVAGAIAKFEDAVDLDSGLVSNTNEAEAWNGLCWYGATWDLAHLVVEACEIAVSLSPNDGGIRDSRGLSRALTGDISGAIEDFEYFISWAEATGQGKNIDWRRNWIAALKTGKNPFDPEMLQRLRDE